MKKLFTFIFSIVLCCNLTANELFVYDNPHNVHGTNVITNELVSQQLSIGSTVSLSDNLNINTGPTENITYSLSSYTFVNQLSSTDVYFNMFPITYTNNFTLPEHLGIKEASPNFSLAKGKIFVYQNQPNADTTVMTSLALVNFNDAKLFISADEDYTEVYVYDGKAIVLESKGKKAKEVIAGNVVVVTPAPAFISPRMPVRKNHTISEGKFEDLEIGNHNEVEAMFKDIHSAINNTIFINHGTNVFGIKYDKTLNFK